MTTFLLLVALIVALAFLYALVLRPWLKKQAWAQRFFAWIDPLELALFKKSETILVGRLLWIGSGIVTLYDAFTAYFSTLNWEPITTRIMDVLHIPQDVRGLTMSAFVAAIGLMIVNLRKKVTKPLDLVAVADDKITPAAAQAMANADAAKDQAVAAVKAN